MNVGVILVVTGGGYAFSEIRQVTGLETATLDLGEPETRPYVVVDRNNNQLLVRDGSEVLIQATVSTGSGDILRETSGQKRSWTFDTPAGHHRVLSKRRDPVWTRPDWAFIEAGLPVPADPDERRVPDALGAYALDLGDGYMIHGAVYERLLGRSTTHGCVRAGRDDLEEIFKAVPAGASVYVFPESKPIGEGNPYTVAVDLGLRTVTLYHGAAELRSFRAEEIERGDLRLPVMRGALLDATTPRSWEIARVSPARVRARREVLQPEVEQTPDPAGAVAYVPPTPDAAMPPPPAFKLASEDGLAIIVQPTGREGVDDGVGAYLGSWVTRLLPDRGERARLRLRMSSREAGELYRALPPTARVVVTRTIPDATPDRVAAAAG